MSKRYTTGNSIQLEKAGLHSVELLVDFLQTSFVDAYKDVHSPKNIELYFSQHYHASAQQKLLTNPDYDVFFAKKATRQVGVLMVHHHNCPLKKVLNASELKQLYLLPTEYGTGLGKYLIEKSFALTRERGNEWMWLCVSELNYRARRFYQKMDFKSIGKGPILKVGTDKLPSAIMLRQLIE